MAESKTFFFLNYNGSRGSSPYDAFSFVPQSRTRWRLFWSGRSSAGHPNSGQPIPGNILQNAGLAIDPIEQGLLKFIPLAQRTEQLRRHHFHFVTSRSNDSDDLNIRLNQTLGGASNGRDRGQRGPTWAAK